MSADTAVNVMKELRQARGDNQAKIDEISDSTRRQYAEQSDPYYATSRLWDDGLIEPADTRDVMGLCLALAARESRPAGATPVYRM